MEYVSHDVGNLRSPCKTNETSLNSFMLLHSSSRCRVDIQVRDGRFRVMTSVPRDTEDHAKYVVAEEAHE